MTAPIHPTITAAVMRLARLYGHAWGSDGDIDAYAGALADLDPSAVDRACDEIAKRERYWPRPVVIRKAVQFFQARASAPLRDRAVPDTYTDDDGATHELFKCRDCQDRGWLPVTAIEGGAVMSWDQVRGVGAYAGEPTPNAAVRRCTHCSKVAAPRKAAVDAPFSEEPRRGGFDR